MKKTAKIISLISVVAILITVAGCFDVKINVNPSGNDSLSTAQQSSDMNQTAVTQSVDITAGYDYVQTATSEYTTAETVNTAAVMSKTPDTMDNSELLAYFNSVLNKVKSDSIGFTKSKLTSVSDIQISNSLADSVANLVKNSLFSNEPEVTSVAKGQSSVDVMSPSGQTFVSRMNMGDIESITCEKNGENYIITAMITPQSNPEKTTGVMSDIFDFATVDDIINVYAPKVGVTVERENVGLDFSDCYAKLTVDSDGRAVNYETYVKTVVNMNNVTVNLISSDVSVTLASTAGYKDFVY